MNIESLKLYFMAPVYQYTLMFILKSKEPWPSSFTMHIAFIILYTVPMKHCVLGWKLNGCKPLSPIDAHSHVITVYLLYIYNVLIESLLVSLIISHTSTFELSTAMMYFVISNHQSVVFYYTYETEGIDPTVKSTVLDINSFIM